MSVQNEIDRIIGLVSDSHEKVKARGGATTEPYLLANLPGAIESIPKGVILPKAEESSFGGGVSAEGDYQIEGQTLDDIADAINTKKTTPSPYTQVEYISISTLMLKDGVWKSACVDTGYKITSEKFKIRMSVSLAANAKSRWICGAETSSPYCLGLNGSNGSYKVYAGNSVPLSVSIPVNELHTIELETFGDGTGQFILDGTATEFSYTGLLNKDNNYYLFDGHTGEIHSCQMYDNGTLVRDFAPAKNSSGEVGLYDRANKVFYTNSYVTGDTYFTSGEEVGAVRDLIPAVDMASEILAIESGVQLPELTNPASASDIVEGKEVIGADGNIITGEVLTSAGVDVSISNSSISVAYNKLVMSQHLYENTMYTAGSEIVFRTPMSLFGNATSDQVPSGVTFTSAAGFRVEGTKEDAPATQAVVLTADATPSANSLTLEFTGLSGEPTLFSVHPKEDITLGSTRYILGVDYDGENTVGIQGYSSGSFMSSSATATYSATAFSWTYANGTLTVTSGSATDGGYFMSGITYQLVYITDTLTQGEVVGPSLDLSQVTVTEASMLDGVKAYDKTGKLIEGSIQSQAAQTITPKTTDQTIAAGKYLSGVQTIEGDSNLVAGNIKKGVSIFGVDGSYEGEGGGGSASVSNVESTPTSNALSISFTGLSGEPTMFSVHPKENITLGTTRYVLGVDYDGETTKGLQGYRASTSATATYSATAFTWKYENGTLTVTSGSATTGGYFGNGFTYELTYITAELGSGGAGGGSSGSIVKGWAETNVTLASGSTAKTNVGTELTHTNGKVSISDSTSVTVSSVDDLEQCKGKYAQRYGTGTTTYDVYFIPEDATFTQTGTTYNKSFTVDTANPMVVLA